MKKDNTPASEIKNKWESFLKEGNEGLKNEQDDKTMTVQRIAEQTGWIRTIHSTEQPKCLMHRV